MVGKASLGPSSARAQIHGWYCPLPEQEQEGGGRDCSPCAGCEQDSLLFSAVCLSSPARAGVILISYPLPPSTVSTRGTRGQSRGYAKGGGTDQGGEKLHSMQACPAPGLVLWEAKECKQSFPRHQSQGPSVSPRTWLQFLSCRGKQGREET